MLPRLTATGNLAVDPELRFTASGTAVCALTVMCNERRRQADGSWKDGASIALRVEVWNEQADHVAASLHRGDAVTVSGSLVEDRYEKDGETVYRIKVRADDVAASLRFHTATVVKAVRGSSSSPAEPVDEPWSAPLSLAPTGTDGVEPPF